MLEPFYLALEIHKICEEELIPKGISPEHDITMHSATTAFYSEAINGAGLHVTGKQAAEAIIGAAGWDKDSPWPGHPPIDLVIKRLQLELSKQSDKIIKGSAPNEEKVKVNRSRNGKNHVGRGQPHR